MRDNLISKIGFVIVVNALVKPVWIFAIDRTVQNIVGPVEYGAYFSLFSLSVILSFFLDLGITNYNNRNIAKYSFLLPKYIKHLLSAKLVLCLLYLLILMAIGFLLGYEGSLLRVLFVLGLNQCMSSLILYFRSNISALQKFTADSIFSIADKLLMISFLTPILFFSFYKDITIDLFIYTQSVSYTVVLCVIAFYNYSQISVFPALAIKQDFLMIILKKSYPYALLTLLVSMYLRSDSIMIERLLEDGKKQAGVYAQSFRLIDAISIVGYLFAGILLPLMSKQIKNKANVKKTFIDSSKLLLWFVIVISLNSFFFAKEIINALYVNAPQSSVLVFSVLLFTLIPVGVYYTFSTFLTANGNIRLLNIISAVSLGLNVVLNFILIPVYGALGAAIASLSTQLLASIFHVYCVKKIIQIPFNKGYFIKGLLTILVLVFLNFLNGNFIVFNLSWYFLYLLFSVVVALLLVLLKLIDLNMNTLDLVSKHKN